MENMENIEKPVFYGNYKIYRKYGNYGIYSRYIF
jgi:hypothetical protein